MVCVSNLYAQNQMLLNQLSMIDAYSQIPVGQNIPFSIEAEFINNGAFTQNNIRLHVKELTSQIEHVSNIPISLAVGNTDTIKIDSIFLPTAPGDYYIVSWLSSDSLPQVLYNDTFKITINNNNVFARDNNTYTGSRWLGATNGLSNPYIATNLYQVKQPAYATGVNFVVDSTTKPGSKVKARLFQSFGALGGIRVIVAESASYYITASDIPTTTGINPPSISISFLSSPYLLLFPDSLYYVSILVYGQTDTVKIATDNTSIPQDAQTSPYFDPSQNNWYIWGQGNVPAMMIRLNTITATSSIPKFIATSLTLYPNPATNILNMDFGGWEENETSVSMFSITGLEVLNVNAKIFDKKLLQIDVSSLSKGMYFIQIKNDKQSIIKKFIKE